MVLIELDKDMEGQHCISLYCEKSDLRSRKVDLLAVNHEHFNREQRKDKTIANWEPDSGIYKVDHRVLKGVTTNVSHPSSMDGLLIWKEPPVRSTRGWIYPAPILPLPDAARLFMLLP
jgi:hypothetical protein